MYGSVTLGIAHSTGIDDVKRVSVRYDCHCTCGCDCDEDQCHDYKTIIMCYARLAVIRIKDL